MKKHARNERGPWLHKPSSGSKSARFFVRFWGFMVSTTRLVFGCMAYSARAVAVFSVLG